MIKVQSEEVKVQQVIVAQLGEEWVVAALDADNKFYRLSHEEDLKLDQALKVADMAKDGMNRGLESVAALMDWVNDQISEILYPEM
ncbi:hypothetical protein [Nostoc sp. DedQUE07]|uniref:hypothetical protein n=1 Tax=Nostoc sp. DedQUE07 TaxID=3075392 RepID=UPI002AD43262|nr:hypothetical protein [Nostoc sp. DedQUE07]MDZ8131937.1 hypothetical protein [Nostoc sp. DedQUE07]